MFYFVALKRNEISMQFLSLFVVPSLCRREDCIEILSCVETRLLKRLLKEISCAQCFVMVVHLRR